MKCFVLFLVCAATLASAAPARALPEGTLFSVVIPNGPDPVNATQVGTVSFVLDTDSGGGCGYYAVWESPSVKLLQSDCWVDERKALGHDNCLTNGQATFTTLVQRDARSSCTGFDTFATPRDLSLLVGLEMGNVGGVMGLLQYSASTWIYPFEATPYP